MPEMFANCICELKCVCKIEKSGVVIINFGRDKNIEMLITFFGNCYGSNLTSLLVALVASTSSKRLL